MRHTFLQSTVCSFGAVRSTIAVVGFLLIALTPVLAGGLRSWTDVGGKFEIKAKFVALKDGKVTLEKEDGSRAEIALDRLSAMDKKFIAELPKEDNPFKSIDNPFKPVPKALAPIPVNWAAARAVDLVPSQSTWKISVDPIAKTDAKVADQPIALPPAPGYKAVVTDAFGLRAVVGFAIGDPQPGGSTRIMLVDLEKGALLANLTAPGQFRPLAIHDRGDKVLMRRDDPGNGNGDRLELWAIAEGSIRPEKAWLPHDNGKDQERDVQWASFLANGNLLTVSSVGRIALWDAETAQPIYHLKCPIGTQPALSPDRKHLAFTMEDKVGVLDVASGKVLATSPLKMKSPKKGARGATAAQISPDGRWLALLSGARIDFLDFAKGAPQPELGLTGVANFSGRFLMPDADFVLVNGQHLLHRPSQIRVWDYQGGEHERVASAGGVTWYFVPEGGKMALVPVRIPNANIRQAIDEGLKDPDFLVLKPGSKVKIDVSGVLDAGHRDKAHSILQTLVAASGSKVGDDGTIELVASTDPPRERKMSYRKLIGTRQTVQTLTVRDHFMKLKYIYKGQPAWEIGWSGNIPNFVRLEGGESLATFIARHDQPNFGFLEAMELPRALARPTGSATLGTSRVTADGVR